MPSNSQSLSSRLCALVVTKTDNMRLYSCGLSAILLSIISLCAAQRITTIQLDGVQYFVSRMNPYSPELNYFLAYQYCRSLGLQLVSFETKEKADSITQYLSNAGYNKYDFWTSGNRLGTDMFLWLSTGLPFNATFNYMRKPNDADNSALIPDIPIGSTSPQRTARESDSGSSNGCVSLKSPAFEWDTDDCMAVKDFICEQTRCYYYNYGSIPVSSAQGKPSTTTPKIITSTSTESSKYDYMHIDNIINKLRTKAVNVRKSEGGLKFANLQMNSDVAIEQSTNGPYDNFNSHAELQDDPSAYMDPHPQEDYASTIEPDKATTFSPAGSPDHPSF